MLISANATETEKIDALDSGADDYLTKPLAFGEFLARLRVALRHGEARSSRRSGEIEIGELRIILTDRRVTIRGQPIALTPTDYKLLALLARNCGRVVPHQQLLNEAWGPNANNTHYLRVYMGRLRRKLDPDRAGACYIVTIARVGYSLRECVAAPLPRQTDS